MVKNMNSKSSEKHFAPTFTPVCVGGGGGGGGGCAKLVWVLILHEAFTCTYIIDTGTHMDLINLYSIIL